MREEHPQYPQQPQQPPPRLRGGPGKDLILSKVFWGAVFAVLAPIIARLTGFDITPTIDGLTETILTALGSLFALYGRVAAVEPVTSVVGISTGDTPNTYH